MLPESEMSRLNIPFQLFQNSWLSSEGKTENMDTGTKLEWLLWILEKKKKET